MRQPLSDQPGITQKGTNNMLNRLKTLRGAEDGFTLVELLVVIVILGILSAVVVFSVRGITDTGGKSACASTQSAISTAAEAVKAQSGAYPANVTDISTFLNTSQVVVTSTGTGFSTTAPQFADKATSPNWKFISTFTTTAAPVYSAATGC
jgi:prepilin-type N-terminal cleavage/methylation domain-containing protein